jgi:hypothetical protein
VEQVAERADTCYSELVFHPLTCYMISRQVQIRQRIHNWRAGFQKLACQLVDSKMKIFKGNAAATQSYVSQALQGDGNAFCGLDSTSQVLVYYLSFFLAIS